MLQHIRDHSQGWIAKALIGFIAALLGFTGLDAIFRASSGQNAEVASVNGEPITQGQLAQAVDQQRRQLLQQLGANFDASLLRDDLLRGSVLSGIVDRVLLLQGAKAADFAFSQEALDRVIVQTPEFQIDGRFSVAQFDQVLQGMGYSRLQFRQLLEQELLIGQLRAGLSGTAFVTDQQAEAFARLEKQTRDFSMLRVSVNPETVSVSDDEINQYYSKHKAQFQSPEQVVVDYVKLKKDRFFDQVSVEESQVQALYEQRIAALAEQRHAAHILISVDKDQDDSAAKQTAEAIRARVNQGEDFAALAKEFSKDPGSAAEGGDLGFAGPGVYEPAFERALYALKAEGSVSEPVRTPFGWHLIKLLGVQAPEVPSLDTLKPDLVRTLKADQVEQRFVEAVKQLETAAYESVDLVLPAKELGLTVQTTAPFSREGGEDIAANPAVIQAAFSPLVLQEGANSALIELDPETAVVLHLKEHKKSEQQSLDQVKAQILTDLRQEKAKAQTRDEGKALLARVQAEPFVPSDASDAVKKEAASLEAVSSDHSVSTVEKSPSDQPKEASVEGRESPKPTEWVRVEAATRVQEGMDSAILQAIFRLPKPSKTQPSYGQVVLANGDFVVLRLEGVSDSDNALTEEQRQEYKRQLSIRIGQQDFAAYLSTRRAQAKIERF